MTDPAQMTNEELLAAIEAARQPRAVEEINTELISSMSNDELMSQIDRRRRASRLEKGVLNAGEAVKQIASGAVEGNLGLLGLAMDLNPFQMGGPNLNFTSSKQLGDVAKSITADPKKDYRYFRTAGEFVAPGGVLSSFGKKTLRTYGKNFLMDLLSSFGSQAAADRYGEDSIAPVIGATSGPLLVSGGKGALNAAKRLFYEPNTAEVAGSAAKSFKNLTKLTPEALDEALKYIPDDELARFKTTAEITENAGAAQLERQLAAAGGEASDYTTRQLNRAKERNLMTEGLSQIADVNPEDLGVGLRQQAKTVYEDMSVAAEEAWARFPKWKPVSVEPLQEGLFAELGERQAGVGMHLKVKTLVDQVAEADGAMTSGALQQIRRDSMALLRDANTMPQDATLLRLLRDGIDEVVAAEAKNTIDLSPVASMQRARDQGFVTHGQMKRMLAEHGEDIFTRAKQPPIKLRRAIDKALKEGAFGTVDDVQLTLANDSANYQILEEFELEPYADYIKGKKIYLDARGRTNIPDPAMESITNPTKEIDVTGAPREVAFGDAKDSDLLRVYHGTPSGDFKSFDPKYRGHGAGGDSAKEAFFTTNNPVDAYMYATRTKTARQAVGQAEDVARPTTYPLNVRFKNPMVIDKASTGAGDLADTVRQAKAKGHDAVVFYDITDPTPGATHIVPIDESQLRSTFNTFNPKTTKAKSLTDPLPLTEEDYAKWRAARDITAKQKEIFSSTATGGALLDERTSPIGLVQRIIRKGDRQSIKQLREAIGNDPMLIEETKRAVVDTIRRDVQNDLTPAGVKKFLQDKRNALVELYGEEGVQTIEKVATDLASEANVANLANRATKGGAQTQGREAALTKIKGAVLGYLPISGPAAQLVSGIRQMMGAKTEEAINAVLLKAALDPVYAKELLETATDVRVFGIMEGILSDSATALKAGARGAALDLTRSGSEMQAESKRRTPSRPAIRRQPRPQPSSQPNTRQPQRKGEPGILGLTEQPQSQLLQPQRKQRSQSSPNNAPTSGASEALLDSALNSLNSGEKSVRDSALDLIKRFEGKRLSRYKDTGGVATIGYGHTGDAAKKSKITEAEAERLLKKDALEAERAVRKAVKADLSENQLEALTSLVFNIGPSAFKKSTLLKKLNRGDIEGAAEEFERWVYDNKKKLPGLVKRRKAEKELFLGVA